MGRLGQGEGEEQTDDMNEDEIMRKRRWRVQAKFLVRQWQTGPCCHDGASCSHRNPATYLDRNPNYPETASPVTLAARAVSRDRLVAALAATTPVCARCYYRRLLMRGDTHAAIRILRALERANPRIFLLSAP